MNIIVKRYSNKKLISKTKFKKVIEIKISDLETNSQATIYFKNKNPHIYLYKKPEYLKICNVEENKKWIQF